MLFIEAYFNICIAHIISMNLRNFATFKRFHLITAEFLFAINSAVRIYLDIVHLIFLNFKLEFKLIRNIIAVIISVLIIRDLNAITLCPIYSFPAYLNFFCFFVIRCSEGRLFRWCVCADFRRIAIIAFTAKAYKCVYFIIISFSDSESCVCIS